MVNLKSINSIYHRTNFNSIIDIRSYRKPEIQNDLPKITKVKWICFFSPKLFTPKNPYLFTFWHFKPLIKCI